MDENKRQCRYWVAVSKKCTKNDGGLFIPMENHIEEYCNSPNHIRCPLLFLSHQKHPITETDVKWDNKRSSVRIHQEKMVTFVAQRHSTLDPIQLPNKTEKIKATTIDMSIGGMRLFTASPLTEDTFIEFSLDKELPPPLQKVCGKVCWCNRQINEPGYQIGIAFTEGQTSRAMASYLSSLSFA